MRKIFLFLVGGIFLMIFGILIGFFLKIKQPDVKSINQLAETSIISPTSIPIPTQTITIDEPEVLSWKVFTSVDKGISFKYPPSYNNPEEYDNYISLISPLNPTQEKGYELHNGELKIEIYLSDAQPNETLEDLIKKKKEQSDSLGVDTKILEQKEIMVDGVKAIQQTWEGMGTGQTILLLNNYKEVGIIKYPAITSRDQEFDRILSTIKLIDFNNNSDLLVTEIQQSLGSKPKEWNGAIVKSNKMATDLIQLCIRYPDTKDTIKGENFCDFFEYWTNNRTGKWQLLGRYSAGQEGPSRCESWEKWQVAKGMSCTRLDNGEESTVQF